MVRSGIARSLALCVLVSAASCGYRSSLDADPSSASVIDFGVVDCGSSPIRHVEIPNEPATEWTAAISGPFAIVGATSGFLDQGSQLALDVRPMPVDTDAPGDVVLGVLHVSFATRVVEIPLRVQSQGTLLTFPTALDFGATDSAATQSITVTNTGKAAATLAFGTPTTNEFRAVQRLAEPNGWRHLAPGESAIATYEFYPLGKNVRSAKLPVSIEGAVCGHAARNVDLRGSSSVGPVKISVSAIDFGTVDCGGTPPPKTFDLYNASDAPFDFNVTTSLMGSGPLVPFHGTVGPKDHVTISYTPPFVWGPFDPGAKLTVTTTAPGDAPHVLPILMQPRGAVLTIPQQPKVGRVRFDEATFVPVSIVNSGTASVTVRLNPYSSPTTVPVGTVSLQAMAKVSTGIGPQPLAVSLEVVQGAMCGMLSGGTVTVDVYDVARSIGTSPSVTCIAAASGTYCEGQSYWDNLGFPYTGIAFPLTKINLGNPSPYRIVVGDDGLCIDATCFFGGSIGTSVTFSPSVALWGSSSGPFHACNSWGDVRCIGRNPYGAWGDPNMGYDVHTTPSPAMGGTPASTYAAGTLGDFAIWGGRVYAAGSKSGWNLGTSSVPDGLVTPFVQLEWLSDATEVSAFYDGACVVRSAGSVWCWSSYDAPAARGAYTDAAKVAATSANSFYVLHAAGGVSYFANGIDTPINGLGTPVQKLVAAGNRAFVIESGGQATRIQPLPITRVVGFDGP